MASFFIRDYVHIIITKHDNRLKIERKSNPSFPELYINHKYIT